MSMEVKGFDELFKTMESLGSVGNKVGKKAVKAASDTMADYLKNEAPKNFTGISPLGVPYDKKKGYKVIKTTSIKTYKSGSAVSRCGISSKDWEEAKHIVFHHYGFINKGLKLKDGKSVTTYVGWIDRAFKKGSKDAEDKMKSVLNSEINKITRG